MTSYKKNTFFSKSTEFFFVMKSLTNPPVRFLTENSKRKIALLARQNRPIATVFTN